MMRCLLFWTIVILAKLGLDAALWLAGEGRENKRSIR